MAVSIELSNTYIKANNHEEYDLVKFYDSDGKFIDYVNFRIPFADYDNFYRSLTSLFFSYGLYPLTDKEVVDVLLTIFPDIDDVIYNPDFDELDEIYGPDYVCRIGSVAIVMKE